ncbi:MAG: PQQ-binding-like beta-propeller repeat protein [Imperialibacter sp.]|uniref:outer membrane protein assembly factor BamB family protein n=1 Tax=Imperialibacter sp. TaxID=2038411 RepID=UPI0032EC2CB1
MTHYNQPISHQSHRDDVNEKSTPGQFRKPPANDRAERSGSQSQRDDTLVIQNANPLTKSPVGTAYRCLFLSLGLLAVLAAEAQVLTPSWEISLPGKLKWMQINDYGILIASCDNGLYGVNPENGDKLWEITTLTNVPEANYQIIDGTPLVLIADKGGDSQTLIINGLNGNLIFDSAKEALGLIISTKVIPEAGGAMIAYSSEAGDGITMFDYVTGDRKWDTKFEKAKGKDLQPQPIIDGEGNIVYALGKDLYKLNGSTGAIMWQTDSKKNYIDLFLQPNKPVLFAVSGSPSSTFFEENTGKQIGLASGAAGNFAVDALDLSSGGEVWKNPVDYSKAKYSGVALGESDFLLFQTFSSGKIDYATGDHLWKKEKMGTGGEKNAGVFVTDKGLGYAMMDAVGRAYINFVNEAGEPMWKKRPVINGQLTYYKQYGNALFFISEQETNFLNLDDGTFMWNGDKYLSAGEVPISVVQDEDGSFVMYIKGKLVRVMPDKQDWVEITSNFAFRGELPTGIQLLPNGYLLTGNQNAMLIDKSGRVLYHKFYPAPEQSFGAKLALGVLGAGTALTSFAYGASSIGYGMQGALQGNDNFTRKAQKQMTVATFTRDVTGGLGAMAQARFGEQAGTDTYKLILTKKDHSIGFVKINILTGEEEGQIVTNDRTPDFSIDPIGKKVFLKSADDRVACYDL